jgi:hypothetical protein
MNGSSSNSWTALNSGAASDSGGEYIIFNRRRFRR